MQDPIWEAIRILIAEADSLRECHTPSSDRDDWTSEPEAKAEYDHMRRVAEALSKLRAPVADVRISLRGAANLAFNALHECKPVKGAEKQHSDAIQALQSALHDIAYTVNRTATPQQFADHLQREARAALASAPVAGEAQPSIMRFNPFAGLGMNPAPNGMYVRYEDHAAMLSRYTAPQASEAVRDAALEEAAQWVDWIATDLRKDRKPSAPLAENIAKIIRSHKRHHADKGGEKCQTCGGVGVVDDGEITGSGGVEFESGPIKCVKDCPDCAALSAQPGAHYHLDTGPTEPDNDGPVIKADK